ncbi:hypothetical protein M407DRAFT_177847 [Tulasnella calospora MUT 4182]|uniref:RRM domain-containing protein n=1 Tax=Tulasnella calospora MUT 4182 TaxID=1051891 RepID=A0A0C3QVT2_9AGAM|nr:hypothetical protein M407DRAFT_177847 [Tulasnella calospora MUT 4182]
MSERLTKKQRKSLAHKERGKSKRAAMLKAMDFDLNAVPKQDLEEGDDDEKITPMVEGEDKRTLPRKDAPRSSSKRKRDENEDIDSSPAQAILPDSNGITAKSTKKRKIEQIAPATPSTTTNDATEPEKSKSKRRYIVFVGNISYKTKPEAIAKHFTIAPTTPSDSSSKPDVANTPQVRMLTSKAKAKGKPENSKGCAFVEFSSAAELNRALRLHNSELDGRTINVEMTVGGGGHGQNRANKLAKKNKSMERQRVRT